MSGWRQYFLSINYTHGKMLGNTFELFGKVLQLSGNAEIFIAHISYLGLASSYRPIYGSSQCSVFVLRRVQYAMYEKPHFY